MTWPPALLFTWTWVSTSTQWSNITCLLSLSLVGLFSRWALRRKISSHSRSVLAAKLEESTLNLSPLLSAAKSGGRPGSFCAASPCWRRAVTSWPFYGMCFSRCSLTTRSAFGKWSCRRRPGTNRGWCPKGTRWST